MHGHQGIPAWQLRGLSVGPDSYLNPLTVSFREKQAFEIFVFGAGACQLPQQDYTVSLLDGPQKHRRILEGGEIFIFRPLAFNVCLRIDISCVFLGQVLRELLPVLVVRAVDRIQKNRSADGFPFRVVEGIVDLALAPGSIVRTVLGNDAIVTM